MEPDLGQAVSGTSEWGAGPLGFAGTTRTEKVIEVVGFATLGGPGLGDGARMPMTPRNWNAELGTRTGNPHSDRQDRGGTDLDNHPAPGPHTGDMS